jgi:molecular chaperone DnaK
MIFQTETQLKELEKLADDHKVAVEYALTELAQISRCSSNSNA